MHHAEVGIPGTRRRPGCNRFDRADGIWESRSRPGAWKHARKTRGVEERAVRQHPDRHGDRDEEGCECEGTLHTERLRPFYKSFEMKPLFIMTSEQGGV